MLVAVDGTSGAGKGTLARMLAAHYNLAFLDTGLLYRAVGAHMLSEGVNLDDEQGAARIAASITWDALADDNLRSDSVAQAASRVAVFSGVREALLLFQRAFASCPPAEYKGSVLDGRDIGTRICPDADFKFYVDADIHVRAGRRFRELQERGIECIHDEVLKDMIQRDQRDQQRTEWPLRPADDAIMVDTTNRTAKEAFNFAVSCIEQGALDKKCLKGG